MGTLTPDAFVKLYSEMLAEGRKTGFGMKNTPEFIRRIELEYDNYFKSSIYQKNNFGQLD